ncbi:MAG: UDP-glucose--hexose-1-phosphate uridylyltransferase [Clostridia bacterium]|nr:UDP-glucose--hexose-1-phosphate uridylyltransferase [Clostridia bacterium]
MIDQDIAALVQYGLDCELIQKEDQIYTTNLILDLLHLSDYKAETNPNETKSLEQILSGICDYAYENGLIEDNSVVHRDLFDTKVMNCLVQRPSEVIRQFRERYHKNPKEATDYYYKLSQDSDYIRRYRIEKDIKWQVDSDYGQIDITINLSKPEKDPKVIALAGKAKPSGYPKCLLCMENEGYAGRLDHPARENHRIIPIEICGEPWGFQYSPYVYYNEHCIVLNQKHVPMVIDKSVFEKLFDFVRQFPHYVIATNADLPIVGGSILSHEHFQGGNFEFAMSRAAIEEHFTIKGFEDVDAGILHWPLSVIRISSKDEKRLVDAAAKILDTWIGYTDEEAFIFSHTNETRHNTITPAARIKNGVYELDLALRNNITTPERPLGVYHPRPEYHHIKKENIGAIEVMGLAILPSRLSEELQLLAEYIIEGKDITQNEKVNKHKEWVDEILVSYPSVNQDNIMGILKKETGIVFTKVLEDAGVFKCTKEGRTYFRRFIEALN